ncbi:hypothetical protein ABPG73_022363 [Tetrahymena malaccensis]
MQVKDDNSVQFSVYNEYEICFYVAEICLQNVYFRQYQLKNPIFTNNINQTLDKPPNISNNMKAIGFITGYIPNQGSQSENQSILLKQIKYNLNDQGFLIEFSIQSPIQISEININYIYFLEDQYGSNTNYFSILNFNDDYLFVNENLFKYTYNASYYISTDKYQLQQEFQNTNLQNTTICGINSFNFCSMKQCSFIRASITFNQKDKNYYYSTWSSSKIFSITSQFVQFQMLNCKKTNQTINFNDKCISQCPYQYILSYDLIRLIQFCSKCSDNCSNCNPDTPYLYNQICQKNQPNNTYCKEVQGYYSCSICSPSCQNYCDSNMKCVDCINGQYYYKSQCVNGIPPINTYQEDGKYYDCDITCKTCSNKGPNSCTSCYSNMVQLNNSCICLEQKYFDNKQLKCLQNPSYKNCEKLSLSSPKCEQCKQGFLNYSGSCIYCGNRTYVASDNQCNGQCDESCFYCSSKDSCQNYDQDLPCYFTCSTCSKPQSQNSCLSCISATRQVNNITNYCGCISGYEESGKVDCNKIKDPINNSQLNFLSIIFQVSLYIQLPLVSLPIYTSLQYSFLIDQQIGIVGLLQGVDGFNLRINTIKDIYSYGSSSTFIQQISQQQLNPNQYLSLSAELNEYKKYSIFLWIIIELRKLISVFVIYKFSEKFWSFICLGSISLIFLIVQIVFKVFIDKKQSLILVTSEVLTILILAFNMVIKVFQNQENNNKIAYSTPTILDIVLITTLILRQFINILSSLYIYYTILKQILQSRKQMPCINKQHENSISYFPQSFDISTISQILEQSGKFQKRFGGYNNKI